MFPYQAIKKDKALLRQPLERRRDLSLYAAKAPNHQQKLLRRLPMHPYLRRREHHQHFRTVKYPWQIDLTVKIPGKFLSFPRRSPRKRNSSQGRDSLRISSRKSSPAARKERVLKDQSLGPQHLDSPVLLLFVMLRITRLLRTMSVRKSSKSSSYRELS